MAIELSEFQLNNSILELRYPHNFLLWDRSGQFWQRLATKFQSLSVKQSDPSKVVVSINDHAEATTGIDRSYISVGKPGANCEHLAEIAAIFLPALIEEFALESFTRVGLRLIYEKIFSTREGAADYVLSNTRIPQLSGRIMNVEGRLLDPETAVRWEAEKNGFHVKLLARQLRINMELPVEFENSKPSAEDSLRNQVLIDIDYYVHSTTLADQLKADLVVEGWSRIIRRDIGKVFDATT